MPTDIPPKDPKRALARGEWKAVLSQLPIQPPSLILPLDTKAVGANFWYISNLTGMQFVWWRFDDGIYVWRVS